MKHSKKQDTGLRFFGIPFRQSFAREGPLLIFRAFLFAI